MNRSLWTLALMIAFLACAGADRPAVRVQEPPPLPRVETAPMKPAAGQVWIPGFWDWNDGAGTWRWIDGSWQLPPRAGAEWIAPRHELRDGTWLLIRGYWK